MKRIIILIIVALPLMAGAQVRTHVDSVNYMLGLMNGDGIRKYVIGADTSDAKKVDMFCTGFEKTVGLREGKQFVDASGYCRGASLAKETRSGFLFDDNTIPANRGLILSTFKDCMRKKPFILTKDKAMAYIQNTVGSKKQKGENCNPTSGQTDTLNRCIGYLNADEALTNILKDGTKANDIDLFITSFENGFNIDEKDENLFKGMDQGLRFTAWLNQDDFIFSEKTLPLNWAIVKIGLSDGLHQNKSSLTTPEKAAAYIQDLNMKLEQQKNAPLIEKSTKFLEDNAKRKEVKTTPSGLQFEIVKQGNGPLPKSTDKVKVHYTGKLIDGTVFDSSVQRGEPLEFPLGQVIKGWQEGIQLMPVGSKYILYIPYTLGYGERGAGNQIPPYSTLIFEVELLDIIK